MRKLRSHAISVLVGTLLACGHPPAAVGTASDAAPATAPSAAKTPAEPRAARPVVKPEEVSDDFVALEPGWPAELAETPAAFRASAAPLPKGAIARLGSRSFALRWTRFTEYALAFAPDGRLLLTNDRSPITQVGSGATIRRFEGSPSVVVSRDGTRVVVGCGADAEIKDAATGRSLATLAFPKPPVSAGGGSVRVAVNYSVCAAFSPDGRSVVMMGRVGEAPAIYDVRTGTRRKALDRSSCTGRRIAWAGKYIACSAGGEVDVRDAATGTRVAAPPGSETFAFNDDGTKLVTLKKGRASIYALPSGAPIATVLTVPNRVAVVAALAHDGSQLAVGTDAGIRVFDVASGKMVPTPPGHNAPVHKVAIAPDGKSLVTSGDDGSVLVWDVATRTIRGIIERSAGRAPLIAISPDGSRLSTVRPNEPNHAPSYLRTYELATGKAEGSRMIPAAIRSLTAARNGRIGLAGDFFAFVVDGERRVELSGAPVGSALAFSPDGALAFSGPQRSGADVSVFEVQSGKVVRVVENPKPEPGKPGVDGLVGDLSLAVRQRESASGFSSGVNALATSADGRQLAVASDQIFLFDSETGQRLGCAPGRATAIAFDSGGQRLVAGLESGEVLVWSVRGFVRPVAETSRTTSSNFWACPQASPLATLQGHDRKVTDVAIANDGSFFASASDDGSVVLWSLP